MTEDDIIRMAREAGLEHKDGTVELNSPYCDGIFLDDLKDFAALVAAAERKACAQTAHTALLGADFELTKRVLRAIRARKEK